MNLKIKALIACGGGIATSTFAAEEIKRIAKELGVDIEIVKSRIVDVPAMAKDFDICFVTSGYSQVIDCPLVRVNGLITGINEEAATAEIQTALLQVNQKLNDQ